MEPHHAGVVGRSCSARSLLEPAPSSLCAALSLVAAGGGLPTHDAAAIVAQQHEAEVMISSQLEKVVVMDLMVAPSWPEAPYSPAEVVVEGGGWKGKAPSGASVGRLFVTRNSCVEVSLAKEADVSSEEEDEEEEKEKKKEKKKKKEKQKEKEKKKEEKKKRKKSSSWWPDPEKRWPIQGFY